MILSDTAIRHRTTVFVLMLIIAVVGGYSYVALPREATPDVEIPYIIVTTTYKGVSPSDVEASITKEIEEKIGAISEVDEITSTSDEGISTIVIKFFSGTDVDNALQKVRDKVDQAQAEMTDPDIDEPAISEVNLSEFPIMMLNIHGPCGLLKLKDIAEDLEEEIERVDGVLEARISGGLTRQIRVEIDPHRLAAYQLPVLSIFETITSENQNVSGGSLDIAEAKYSVRVEGEFVLPSEIINLIVYERGGKPIYLSDIATVRDAFEDRLSISRFDGSESVTVSVVKQAGKNIVEIADKVREIIAAYERRLPTGTAIDVTLDQSKIVRLMVKDLENNLITGMILVVIVLMIAMGVRNSVLVAVAIPFSMLITFAILQAMGVTLNLVVLFSLILVLGMLVDNAIVIVENVYRHRQEGLPRVKAAMVATSEVAWPVITSTLTTLGAFAPMLWWPGMMGQFMAYLPRTLIVALLASLFVAMIINPTLCSVFVKPGRRKKATGTGDAGHWLTDAYRAVLTVAIRPGMRIGVVLVAVLCLVASGYLFVKVNGKVELFPEPDPAVAQVNISMPVGTRLEETDRVAREVEKIVREFQYVDDGSDPKRNIRYITTNVGSASGTWAGFMGGGGGGGSHKAQISFEFLDFDDREVSSDTTVKALRKRLVGIPGADIKVDVEEEGPPTGKPVAIRIAGDEYDELLRIAERVKALVAEIPGVTDLDDDYDEGKPELRIDVDRQRARLLDLNTGVVAQKLKAAVNGIEVGKYRQGNDDYDIIVRLPEKFRRSIADIEALTIATPTGKAVPLSTVATIRYTAGLASINRIDEKRAVTVSSEVIKGHENNANKVIEIAEKKLKSLDLPPGYSISFVGEQEEQNKATAFLAKAGVIAIFVIALILVTQFNSVSLPFIILLSVILSWIGVFLGLVVFNMPFGIIMTGVGVISLAGVVVNNSIVLIDYTEKLRQRGLPLIEAVIQAGTVRLRPVLLTAVTTILGLLPMVLGWNIDFRAMVFNFKSESSVWWGPMATVVVFGLGVATVLTLVVLPAVYVMLNRLRNFWGRHVHDDAHDRTDEAPPRTPPA
jgi:multidrug efflux pump